MNSGLSCFDNIVSIGDSLSCGYQRVNNILISNNYNYSPFQYFVKKYNTKVYWGGASGMTTKTFLENKSNEYKSSPYTTKGLNYVKSLKEKSLYIISLGTNDCFGTSATAKVPIGSKDTINDTNTFYGCLNQIIKELMKISPTSYFILVSAFRTDVSDDYRVEAPKYVSSLYTSALFIDITNELKGIQKYTRDGHYTTEGYYLIGSIIDRKAGEKIASLTIPWNNIINANVNSYNSNIDPYEKE